MLYRYLLLFYYIDNQIFDITMINKIVFAELLTEDNDHIGELFGIVSSIILHNLYENQNLNVIYIKKFDYNSL